MKWKAQVAPKHQSGSHNPISLHHLKIDPFACGLHWYFHIISCWGWVQSINKAFLIFSLIQANLPRGSNL